MSFQYFHWIHRRGSRVGSSAAAAVACLLILCSFTSLGAEALVAPGVNQATLTRHAQVLRDPGGRLTFEEARASAGFKAAKTSRLNFGYTRDVIWIRVKLRNPAETRRSFFLHGGTPTLHSIHFIHLDADGRRLARYETGTDHVFHSRPVRHRAFFFPVTLPAASATTLYLRVYSPYNKEVPLRLLNYSEMHDRTYDAQMIQGIYFGVLFVAFAYNLFLFLSVRDRAYLLYSLYVAAMAFFVAYNAGYVYQYLWPNAIGWNQFILPPVGALLIASICVFTLDFLNLRNISTRLRRSIIVLAIFSLLVSPFAPVLPIPGILNYVGIIACVLLFIAGFRALAADYRPARFFLLAFGILLVAALLYALALRGINIPGVDASRALEVGSALEVIILSLGLGDRINLMREKNRLLELEARARAEEKRRLELEMSVARKIQLSILPEKAPAVRGLIMAARYIPMDAVGGDLYDFYQPSPDTLGVIVADVSGHGVPAALIGSMVKVSGASHAHLAADPEKFLDALNRDLLRRRGSDFVTVAFGFFDPQARRLYCCTAGHPPVLHLREGKICSSIRPRGRILGVFDEPATATAGISLETGDRVVFYTDGILEAESPLGEQYGAERLAALLMGLAEHSAEQACDALLRAVRDWRGRPDLDDDVTLVIADLFEE